MNRKTPWHYLIDEFEAFYLRVKYASKKNMWTYPKEKLGGSWSLCDLDERIAAADQLGYEVVLKSTQKGIEVWYQEKRPTCRRFE